jgi:U4/U6.U5 tri-snRNP component SNU23
LHPPVIRLHANKPQHRRTWDREEWAAKAKERETKERSGAKLRAEAKAAGKKYYAPVVDDAEMISARRERINFEENLNKVQLVPGGATVGKKGKGAGFYCNACDLTFKDSLQWVDHLNSKQHLVATGKTAEVERASLEDVLKRLEWLKRKKSQQENGEDWDLKKRLEVRAQAEEEERRQKREKRKEKRKKGRAAHIKKEDGAQGLCTDTGTAQGAEEEVDEDAAIMARMMGFSGGFGSTKKN